jgi:hypothetical protein
LPQPIPHGIRGVSNERHFRSNLLTESAVRWNWAPQPSGVPRRQPAISLGTRRIPSKSINPTHVGRSVKLVMDTD